MTVFTVSSKLGTKQSLPIVSGEPARRHELIKQDPKRSGWLRTNRQVSAEPDSWLVWPQVLRGIETSVFPSDFSKLNILNSFNCSSVTWSLLLVCYRWLISLVDILQGVAKLNYQASDQHWYPYYVLNRFVSDSVNPGTVSCQAPLSIESFRPSSQPRDQTTAPALQVDSLPSEPPEKPWQRLISSFFLGSHF